MCTADLLGRLPLRPVVPVPVVVVVVVVAAVVVMVVVSVPSWCRYCCSVLQVALLLEELGEPSCTTKALVAGVLKNNEALAGKLPWTTRGRQRNIRSIVHGQMPTMAYATKQPAVAPPSDHCAVRLVSSCAVCVCGWLQI